VIEKLPLIERLLPVTDTFASGFSGAGGGAVSYIIFN
jgi:hypothetical protein